ncbi:sugar kinase [Reichenbachiella versicolor]|uniref:sugar kinase n=1 Tax=Reichenbachiella versicolor TaxID=1821036 RepID=UPI000D6DE9DF|nr:sugar kinase [Reichenbachiella versicolor]
MNKIVCFGELLLRLSPPGYYRIAQTNTLEMEFGGAEYNVATSLAHFGEKPAFVSRVPQNKLGKRAMAEIRRHGIDSSCMVYGGDRLGLYFVEKGVLQRPTEIIYDRENSSLTEAEPLDFDWDKILNGANWFHFTGISPAISQKAADLYLYAAKKASDAGITISCDVNFRPSLWKYGKSAKEVLPELLQFVNVIFGNERDAEHLFDITPPKDDSDLVRGYKEMMIRLPKLRKIVSTKRKVFGASHNEISAVFFDGEKIHQSKEYDINPIVDRIGGGDAFVAGFIHGYLKYEDRMKALEFATAASCLKHSIPGDANYVSSEEVERLAFGDSSYEVKR